MPFSHPAAPLVMELLSESISFYNLAWTVLLVLCMVYWLSVIVGLADMDFLDVDLDLDGDADIDKEINVNPTLANMLINRGVQSFDQAKDYFRPSLSQLHDPFLMKDMDAAVNRIEKAVNNQEKILVYGDYDVDGTTAVALMYSFLKGFYPQVEFYIPDRYKEGYGISERGVRFAAENGFSLVIALDCGIKAIDKVKLAKELGVDFIICDHHTPGDELPEAVAVLDAKREDCTYPYKELSGCGVGFKLIQAYAKTHGLEESSLYPYLDLLVVSIAADIVPITGENRILAYYGLDRINNTPGPGLKALILQSKVEKEIQISDIVFKIGPRINASGRLEHAQASVELLIAPNLDDAIERVANAAGDVFGRGGLDGGQLGNCAKTLSELPTVLELTD